MADVPGIKDILDPALISKLDQLEVLTRKVFRGRQKGERRSRKKGQSVEFADYREYVPGDDTRFLDWNVFGRLERLYIKLFLEEEDLAFYVIVDTSASMNFGTPITKFEYARKLAAALGYVGLKNQDKVGISDVKERVATRFRPVRGKAQMAKLATYLLSLEPSEGTNLVTACRDFVIQNKQSGIVVLVSDFLDERGYEDALKHFFLREYDVYCIQVLSPEERDPKNFGHLELIDAETGERQEVTASEALIKQYKQTLENYCTGLRDYCTARGMTYLAATTDLPVETMLLAYLRQRGLLR
ncbi:MAG: DUF58 domain-containing protein [Candidatus Competibacteraceae bacterium]|nr:DUF58 domain-containing protein [Candidatus Competibacteraceae bacterium]